MIRRADDLYRVKRIALGGLMLALIFGISVRGDTAPAGAATPATTQFAPPVVLAEAIEEFRAANSVKLRESAGLGGELTLGIGYTPDLDSPSGYGRWNIREAVDERGNDLRPPAPPKEKRPPTSREFEQMLESATDFVQSDEAYTQLSAEVLKGERQRGASRFKILLRLGLAPRAATRIARLAGDVTVYAGGHFRTVTFDRPTRFYGHRLEAAPLRAAGVDIDLLPADAQPDPNQMTLVSEGPHVRLRCRGDLHAFVHPEIQVVGPDGKDLSAGFSDGIDTDLTDQNVGISLSRPLDDTMKIQVSVVIGRRPVVVPFDLRDIKLP